MQAAHVDEHEQIASHVAPGHALLSGQPPFFLSRDAVNFAALDYLVGFAGKVGVTIPARCSCYSVLIYQIITLTASYYYILYPAFNGSLILA